MFVFSFILNRWLILGCICLHLRNTNTVKLQRLCSEPARHLLTQPQVLSLCCSVFISQGERWPALPCCVHRKKKTWFHFFFRPSFPFHLREILQEHVCFCCAHMHAQISCFWVNLVAGLPQSSCCSSSPLSGCLFPASFCSV